MNTLLEYRKEIDKIDSQILSLFAKRFSLVTKIGVYKKSNNLPIVDSKREQEKLEELYVKGEKYHITKAFIKNIWKNIFTQSYELEK